MKSFVKAITEFDVSHISIKSLGFVGHFWAYNLAKKKTHNWTSTIKYHMRTINFVSRTMPGLHLRIFVGVTLTIWCVGRLCLSLKDDEGHKPCS